MHILFNVMYYYFTENFHVNKKFKKFSILRFVINKFQNFHNENIDSASDSLPHFTALPSYP